MQKRFSLGFVVGILGILGLAASPADAQMAAPYMGPMMMPPPPGVRAMARPSRPAFRVSVAGPEDELMAPEVDGMGVDYIDGSKHKSCGVKGKCTTDCYCVRVYGEYLYLRPRDAEVAYAVESNLNVPGTVAAPIQTSPVALLDHDFSSGFRFGFGVYLDPCTELGASYTWYESGTSSTIERGPDAIGQIDPMALHPATRNAVSGTAAARGRQDIDFDLLDVDYRGYWINDYARSLNYLVGIRWGQLNQEFSTDYTDDLMSEFNDAEVDTEICYEGVGLRLGLEGERRFCRLPVMVYGRGIANILAGEADATFQQTVQNNSNVGVDTAWGTGRIVPTFDLEIGAGLYGCCNGHVQLTVGYVFSAWTNMVKTEDWINAVHRNDFADLGGDTLTFDGFLARVEGKF